jgi:hypothetical protein
MAELSVSQPAKQARNTVCLCSRIFTYSLIFRFATEIDQNAGWGNSTTSPITLFAAALESVDVRVPNRDARQGARPEVDGRPALGKLGHGDADLLRKNRPIDLVPFHNQCPALEDAVYGIEAGYARRIRAGRHDGMGDHKEFELPEVAWSLTFAGAPLEATKGHILDSIGLFEAGTCKELVIRAISPVSTSQPGSPTASIWSRRTSRRSTLMA